MTPHEAAQTLWWFVVVVLIGIGVVLWWDVRKELRDSKKDVRTR